MAEPVLSTESCVHRTASLLDPQGAALRSFPFPWTGPLFLLGLGPVRSFPTVSVVAQQSLTDPLQRLCP